jgi:hypothetical protein
VALGRLQVDPFDRDGQPVGEKRYISAADAAAPTCMPSAEGPATRATSKAPRPPGTGAALATSSHTASAGSISSLLLGGQGYRSSLGGSEGVGGFWPLPMYPMSSLFGRNGGGDGRGVGSDPFGCESLRDGSSDMDVTSSCRQCTGDDE